MRRPARCVSRDIEPTVWRRLLSIHSIRTEFGRCPRSIAGGTAARSSRHFVWTCLKLDRILSLVDASWRSLPIYRSCKELRFNRAGIRAARRNSTILRTFRESGRGHPSSCRKRLRSNYRLRLAINEVLLLHAGPDGTFMAIAEVLIRRRR